MLATAIHSLCAVHRGFRKMSRALAMLADAFEEAQEYRRTMRRRRRHVEE